MKNNPIVKDFLKLTSNVYPYEFEKDVVELIEIPLEKDKFGNYFYIIGTNPTAIFTSHLDTVGDYKKRVKHVFDNNFVQTDGSSILGADDKAGVVIMLHMIREKTPGIYYFFIGEEVGRIGSIALSNEFNDFKIFNTINKIVSFDRKGVDSIITHQMGSRGASDEFADALANALNSLEPTFKYKADATGLYTDSYSFMSQIQECINLSVGYYFQHTHDEKQDLNHLIKLANALCKVEWESLPIKRKLNENLI